MKRIMSTMKKRGGSPSTAASQQAPYVPPQGDSPEAVVVREVTAFCESGAPDSQNAGDEYLHLPAIVDSAESSPAAATEAAKTIRRYLSKENYQRGFAQYNAIMLTRILTDNPAEAFTRNFDKQFIGTVKELLRDGKDASVQQILRETLDYFEVEKLKTNDTLGALIEMWRKEKGKTARMYGNYANGPRTMRAPPFNQYQSSPHHQQRSRGLPPPEELASRIEEAKTTARLLLQTIQSTPKAELSTNELVKEFADRAKSAHRSIQIYMSSENPRPDEDTMLTLIETNDQLNIAMSKHQRALLEARKATGMATPSPQPQGQPGQQPGQNAYFPPQSQNSYGQPPNQVNPYGQVPAPPQQNPYNPPSSPPRETDDFKPPSGPPPGARGAVRSQDYGYSSGPPSLPSRNQPTSPPQASPTQAAHYGVAENPFADDAVAQPPPQKSRGLFGDNSYAPPPPQSTYQQPSQNSSMYSDHQRPQVPFAGTQSYMNRQDSATNHLTMHGASPPPPESQQASNQSPNASSSVSQLDDVNGVQNRMGNLRV